MTNVNVNVRVGTGRTIHAGYKNERGTFVSCGVVRHGSRQRMEIMKGTEVTCKKCLAAQKEEVKQEVELDEMAELKRMFEKKESFIIKK